MQLNRSRALSGVPGRAARLGCSTIIMLVMTVMSTAMASAQSALNSEWETLRPEGEEFTILMPKNPTIEISKVQYHKMELNSRLYLSSTQAGPVLAVVSLSGIKSNPALYSDLERFNSYVDAFKNWFPSKARGKDAVAKLSLVGNTTFHGHPGREYKLTIGELSGVAQTYSTRRRFYAVVVLNTKKDDSLKDRFLGSFVLPDRTTDTRPTIAALPIENPTEALPASASKPPRPGGEPLKNEGESDSANALPRPPETADSKPQSPAKRAPISGGILNGKAIYLPQPDYPPGNSSGVVMIQVLVDEQGNVVEARAVSGPQPLQAAAVTAAHLAKFSATTLMGEPVKVSGILSYSFTR
jgi:hypothetical protein